MKNNIKFTKLQSIKYKILYIQKYKILYYIKTTEYKYKLLIQ